MPAPRPSEHLVPQQADDDRAKPVHCKDEGEAEGGHARGHGHDAPHVVPARSVMPGIAIRSSQSPTWTAAIRRHRLDDSKVLQTCATRDFRRELEADEALKAVHAKPLEARWRVLCSRRLLVRVPVGDDCEEQGLAVALIE